MTSGAPPGNLSALATPGREGEGSSLLDVESLTPRTRAQAAMRRSHSATEVGHFCRRQSCLLPIAMLAQFCAGLRVLAAQCALSDNAAVQAAQSFFASYISRRFMSGW